MTSEPTATQALHGTPLSTAPRVSCEDCTADLELGDAITIHVHPQEEWTPTAAYCPTCTPDTTDDPTITVEGWLTTTIDPRTDKHVLTFATTDYALEDLPLDTTGTGTDPPATANHGPDAVEDENEEGDPDAEPTAEPTLDPDHVLVPFRSNRADRVFHFDNGERAPCCEATGEYEAVPIEEARDHAPRACRACEREQRGRWETRPCPHCNEPIALTHWPMHVRNCSGSTQGPTDAGLATDSDSKTDTDRNAPTDDQVERHAGSERTADPHLDPNPDPDHELHLTRLDYGHPIRTDREFEIRIDRAHQIGADDKHQTTVDRHYPRTRLDGHPSSRPPERIAISRAGILREARTGTRNRTTTRTEITTEETGTIASDIRYASSRGNGFEPSVRTGYAKLGTQPRRKGKTPVQASLFGHWSKIYRPPAEAVAIRSRGWTRTTREPRSRLRSGSPPASRSIDRPVVRRVAVRQCPTGQTMHTPSSGIRPRPTPMSPGVGQHHISRPEAAPEHGQRAHSTGFDSVGRPSRPRYDPRRESTRKDVFELAVVSVLKDVFERSADSKPLLAAHYRRFAHRSPAIAVHRDLHTQ